MQKIEGSHRLYCEAAPPSDKPPILLLHGFLSSKAQWRDNLTDLARYTRPVVVELPGHGRSPSPTQPSYYELASLLGEFELIRAAIGCERWLVCGHSLGGAFALNYALRYPEAVAGLVFTNSRSALEGSNGSLRKDSSPIVDGLRKNGLAALEGMPFHPRHMRNVSSALRDEIVDDAKRIDPDGVANLMAGALNNISVHSEIGRVTVPVMLVNGTQERSFQESREWLENTRPDFDIVDLNCGHSPNAEEPDQFNDVLRAFISSL